MRLRSLLLVLVPLVSACAAAPRSLRLPETAPDDRSLDIQPWAAPPLERAIAIREPVTGRTLTFTELIDELARADAVFLGETHLDETTHRVELAVYEALRARRGGRVVLALEMFERDAQPALDAYLRGETSEAKFLESVRQWGNYREAYRPMIESAKAAGAPVVASNFPRPLLRRVSSGGLEALESLEGDERKLAPREVFANSAAYHRRVDNAIRGHLGMMGPRDPDDPRLTSTQTLWDNAMGESCALALDEHPGHAVVHVNGGFHSAYHDGTVAQFKRRKPDARVRTISIVPTVHPAVAEPSGVPVADFVVYAEARASDVNEGKHAVQVSRELDYRLHVPDVATAGEPVPLLVWLGEDGLTSEDGMALWKERLGDEAAIAVLEAPYRAVWEDLAEGGRWFWPDSFSQDVGLLGTAVERTWGYLLRHHPIDPARVCIAGEGAGATIVAAVSLLSDRIDHRALAFAPRQYAKIKDFPLPLPELRGDDEPAAKSLRLFLGEADGEWWQDELEAYRGIGFDAEARSLLADGREASAQQWNALREALGLPGREDGTAETSVPVNASVRARHWARIEALHADASTSIAAEDFRGRRKLPRCPGAFGGTTVVVLPEGMAADEVEAWRDLQEEDPLQAASRFHRLRVVPPEGEPTLAEVLENLRAARRRNVLIVPAVFHEPGAWMRRLKSSVADFEDAMTLRWRPGLGGLPN